MGSISLQIPQSNLPNSTEDPKIASDLTTIQTAFNGNIDHTNLSASAAILVSQMATGAVRFNTRVITTSSATLADGDYATVTTNPSTGVTITLPPAALGAWCAVTNRNAASVTQVIAPITIQAQGSDLIFVTQGYPVDGVTSIPHTALCSPLVFYTSAALTWQLVAGTVDFGWQNLGLGTNITALAGGVAPQYRLLGDQVLLRGAFKATAAISAAATVLTIPTAPFAFSFYPGQGTYQTYLPGTSVLTGTVYPLDWVGPNVTTVLAIPINTQVSIEGQSYSVLV